MHKLKRKEWFLAALFLFVLGLVNLAGDNKNEAAVFYNGVRRDIVVEDKKVEAEDFFVLCGVPYDGAEKKANLVDLCARLNIDCRFDEEENIYALGDTAEYAREVPVLMYHHLLPENELWQRKRDNITITVEEFTAQMDYLAVNGWKCVSLEELEEFVRGERLLAPKSVLITFDDGFLSNYTYAYPILKERGMKAVLFVLSDYLSEEEKKFEPSLMQYLSRADLLKMQDVFSYGSHTAALHQLKGHKSTLCLADEETIVRDLARSRKALMNAYSISYPYGEYNDEVLKIAKESGFRLGFAVGGHSVKMYDDPYTLGRFDMYRYRDTAKFQKMLESCAQ